MTIRIKRVLYQYMPDLILNVVAVGIVERKLTSSRK